VAVPWTMLGREVALAATVSAANRAGPVPPGLEVVGAGRHRAAVVRAAVVRAVEARAAGVVAAGGVESG
jgi:hypothetical protein